MRSFFVFGIILLSAVLAFAQNEQAPIIEKEIDYKDWTYKNVLTGEKMNLRDFSADKKLVIVVYYAPWCGNWRHDAPILTNSAVQVSQPDAHGRVNPRPRSRLIVS